MTRRRHTISPHQTLSNPVTGFVSVSIDDYASAASAAGVPDDDLRLLRYVFKETLDGRNASLGDGMRRALDRAPRDFADYARDVAATGAWQP